MEQNKENTYNITVKSEDEDLRLDRFLGATDLVKNRSQALKLIVQKRVTCKGQILKASYKLIEGDCLTIVISEEVKEGIVAYDISLDIVYEDKEILVINKPAGLVVYPGPGHSSDTLVNALFHHKKLLLGTESLRPGIVHRLDKNTSGLLVVARTQEAEDHLIDQFKNRSVQRIYWALTLKTPRSLSGTVTSYLCRHPMFRKKFVSIKEEAPGSKEAITHYKTLKQHNNGIAWLECKLDTGRTHQIRIHMLSLSCPVLGDEVYCLRLRKKSIQKICADLNRVALHAQSLSFIHPKSGKTMSFTSPWPLKLEALVQQLGFSEELQGNKSD